MANIVHAKNVTVADWSGVVTVGDSTGGTTTDQASNLARPSDWNSQHNFTLSASDIGSFFAANNGLSASTNTNGVTYGIGSVQFYEPFNFILGGTSTTVNPAVGSWYLDPVVAPFGIPQGRIGFIRTNAVSQFNLAGAVTASLTGSVTRYASISNDIAFYSQGTGASSTALYSFWSNQIQTLLTHEFRQTSSNTAAGTTSLTVSQYATVSLLTSVDSSGGQTYGTFTNSGTSSTAATTTQASTFGVTRLSTVAAYVSNSFFDVAGFGTSLAPGHYVFANMWRTATSSSGTNNGAIGSLASFGQRYLQFEGALSQWKSGGQSVANSSTMLAPWHGALATTTSAATSKIATSDIRVPGNMGKQYFNVQRVFS